MNVAFFGLGREGGQTGGGPRDAGDGSLAGRLRAWLARLF